MAIRLSVLHADRALTPETFRYSFLLQAPGAIVRLEESGKLKKKKLCQPKILGKLMASTSG
jgi:hypothetical protein